MEHVRLHFAHERGEELRRVGQVLLRFLHPLQAERGGMVVKAVQGLHPCGLLGQRYLAEADEGDLHSAGHEAGDQFARVCPSAGQGVGCDQYVHRAP